MIILTAGHTGAGTGAQCAETHFDEGAENIWLRNRIAEILTNRYGLVVLMDDDRASLKLLTKALSEDVLSLTENISLTDNILHTELTDNTEDAVAAPAILSPTNDTNIHKYEKLICDNSCNLRENSSFLIDIHFNAHSNPQARGAEAIVSDDATTLELRMASRLRMLRLMRWRFHCVV